MSGRGPRFHITLTEPEERWLRWYAAQVGRTPASTVSRLVSAAIEQERSRAHLEAAYAQDLAAAPLPPGVQRDIALAFTTPGVANVLAGDVEGSTSFAREAAGYLQAISQWLEDQPPWPRAGRPPQLAEGLAAPSSDTGIAAAIAAFRQGFPQPSRAPTPDGTLMGSDKRTLSDSAAGIAVGEG